LTVDRSDVLSLERDIYLLTITLFEEISTKYLALF